MFVVGGGGGMAYFPQNGKLDVFTGFEHFNERPQALAELPWESPPYVSDGSTTNTSSAVVGSQLTVALAEVTTRHPAWEPYYLDVAMARARQLWVYTVASCTRKVTADFATQTGLHVEFWEALWPRVIVLWDDFFENLVGGWEAMAQKYAGNRDKLLALGVYKAKLRERADPRPQSINQTVTLSDTVPPSSDFIASTAVNASMAVAYGNDPFLAYVVWDMIDHRELLGRSFTPGERANRGRIVILNMIQYVLTNVSGPNQQTNWSLICASIPTFTYPPAPS